MSPSPPPLLPNPSQEKTDRDHVDLLAIFHFVFCGLGLLGIAFLFLHYTFMSAFLLNPDIMKNSHNGNFSPQDFFSVFIWFYIFLGAIFALEIILNLLCGLFLRRKKYRTFCLVVAAINCLQLPFGTALGVFTFMVLMRPSVRQSYEDAAHPLL